jgi:hypothetical protein
MALSEIGALFLYFLMLAFVAVGGAPSVLPEMHRYVVEVHAWITSTQFAELYALAQVAPGPNVMYIPLIGWSIAGWAGAAATTIPFVMPSVTLTMVVAHLHARSHADHDRAHTRERLDTDARGRPRLARLSADSTDGRDGTAHFAEPDLAARHRCGSGTDRTCVIERMNDR